MNFLLPYFPTPHQITLFNAIYYYYFFLESQSATLHFNRNQEELNFNETDGRVKRKRHPGTVEIFILR